MNSTENITKAEFDTLPLILANQGQFEVTSAYASNLVSEFNLLVPTGSRIAGKFAGSGHSAPTFAVVETTGLAITCTVPGGYLAMVPTTNGLASLKNLKFFPAIG